MNNELNDILKKIATAKGITAILIILLLGIFVWKNIDFLTEVSFTLKKPDTKAETKPSTSEKNKRNVPDLAIGDIILSPAPQKLPSIVIFRIDNNGDTVAKEVMIAIDFGSSKVIDYEVIGPRKEEVTGSDANQSAINIDINQLRPHESAYVYVQTSYPAFNKIAISNNEPSSVIEYTYSEYISKSKKLPIERREFFTFITVLFCIFLVVMSIYFTIVLIQKLNKWMNI